MLTMQEATDGFALFYARDPWERVHIRVRAFASATHVSDRNWYQRMCAYADRVIAEELPHQSDAGQLAQ